MKVVRAKGSALTSAAVELGQVFRHVAYPFALCLRGRDEQGEPVDILLLTGEVQKVYRPESLCEIVEGAFVEGWEEGASCLCPTKEGA